MVSTYDLSVPVIQIVAMQQGDYFSIASFFLSWYHETKVGLSTLAKLLKQHSTGMRS
jgi:hypothetical protein